MTLTGLTTTTATEILIYALAGLGINLLLGYSGLASFGHGIFFGVAAYAASIIQVQLIPESIFIPILLAVSFTTLIGFGIGFLSLLLRGGVFLAPDFVIRCNDLLHHLSMDFLSRRRGRLRRDGAPGVIRHRS